jgi:DNA-binding MarR family transcriptional regulator
MDPHGRNANELDELVVCCRILLRVTRQDCHELTIRQLAVLLTCYLLDEDHTVRMLAARLRVSRAAVSRMLGHLVGEGLIKRQADPSDGRSVLFERTLSGWLFLDRLKTPALSSTPGRQRS